jgi:hypothetical protein
MGALTELIPSVVVLGFFIALVVTAIRATDRRSSGTERPDAASSEGADVPSPGERRGDAAGNTDSES